MLPKDLIEKGFKESDFVFFYGIRFFKLKEKSITKIPTLKECYIASVSHQPYGCHLVLNGHSPCKECFRNINLSEVLPKTNNNTLDSLFKIYSKI